MFEFFFTIFGFDHVCDRNWRFFLTYIHCRWFVSINFIIKISYVWIYIHMFLWLTLKAAIEKNGLWFHTIINKITRKLTKRGIRNFIPINVNMQHVWINSVILTRRMTIRLHISCDVIVNKTQSLIHIAISIYYTSESENQIVSL